MELQLKSSASVTKRHRRLAVLSLNERNSEHAAPLGLKN